MAETSAPVIKREIKAAASWLVPTLSFLKKPFGSATGSAVSLNANLF